MKDKKTITTVITLILIICLVVVGSIVSYSYFSVESNYDENANVEKRTTVITTDVLDVDFTTSKYIDNNDLVLITSSEVEEKAEKTVFNVSKKEGKTYNIKYDIYLTNFSISDNLISNDFKWQLLENGVVVSSGNFSNAVSGDRYNLTTDSIQLTGDSANYEFRMWLEETDVDQENLFNGTFTGKVALDIYTVANN